ncbi:MAG: thiosulfate oxidation carrier protein SoxY [Candidatus Parabeggiatoa sp. nov. 1]|nr:MAG: thiosulfate oxidation carrier protein SoxY [Gammaproteobacteria bacterium]HEC84815.1 thiosulfate oxidation carrier protein SoxY [Thioploca sp.]
MSRRTFLRSTVALGAGATILPATVMAEAESVEQASSSETAAIQAKSVEQASSSERLAFQAESVDKALSDLFNSPVVSSDKITIKTPDIAENGKVVPVKVTTDLPNVESITILSEANPKPLVAQFNFIGEAKGWIKTRIKMGGTGNVIAVVKAEGKLYQASREVKITIGGCGG